MTQIFEPKTTKYNARRASMLIIHGTEVDANEAHAILGGQREREASAHYMINEQGKIIQYLDESARAWHAGLSYWSGFTDINSASIGIELVCISKDGSFSGDESRYTEAQMTALAELCKGIIERQKIPAYHVLAHEDIAPGRRFDPGIHFDWAWLAQQGIGLWHDLEKIDNDVVSTDAQSLPDFKTKLSLFGYKNKAFDGKDETEVIRAFQKHFLPWNVCGLVTEQSMQALDILLRKKEDLIG